MRLWIIGALMVGCAFPVLAAEPGGVRPKSLLCEHLQNPLGLDAAQPRLSWSLQATQDGQRAQTQTAYQILVAGSVAKLAADEGDLWDSGKTASPQCVDVRYGGQPLQSCQPCFWKVRVWDQNDAVSAWSAPAAWSMGILDPQQWQGKWLSYVKLPPVDPAQAIQSLSVHGTKRMWFPEGDPRQKVPAGTRYFRQTFELPADARVRWGGIALTVDDRFTLFINGREVGRGGDAADAWKHPQAFDFTRFLTPGRNVIAIAAVNNSEGPAGLFASWKVEFADGSCINGLSDASWSASKTAPAGWNTAAFNDARWARVKVGEMINLTPDDKTPIVVPRSDWPEPAASPLFRKTFRVAKPVARAMVYICGLGYYELHLNGGKVGDRVLDPVFTRYDKRALYATYDVTDQMKSGDNAVGVMLGNGFLNPAARDAWYFEKAPWRDHPQMRLQLRLEYKDGTSEVLASDETWRAATGPVTHDGIRHGEYYDARLEMPGWDTAAFDDAAWAAPQVVAGPKGVLSAEAMAPNRVVKTITPLSMTEPQPGVFVFDMGQNFSGWAQLKVAGPAGTKVTLHYSERLNADGTVDQRISAPYVFEGPFQTNQYILKGQGEEVWEPRFAFSGYRWVEVRGFPGKPTIDSIRGRVVHTDFGSAGSFECSNALLNKIQQMTLWSYRSNYVGFPTDCPHREKNGWTGDAHLAAEQAMFNFYNVAGYETWMNNLKDEQRPSGELPGIVPTSGWGYAWGNGPAWDSAYTLIPWYLYQYYGDVGVLETHYDRLKLYVDYLSTRAKDNLVDIGLGDWLPAKTTTPVEVTSTGYYYVDAVIVAKIARLLGKDADAQKYEALAEKIRQSFVKKYCGLDGAVANNSQTSLSCALHQGLAPADLTPAIMKRLVANVEANDNHLDTGILGMKYLFRTLTNNGHADLAYRIATQTTPPSYGAWVQRGATTLWEDWEDGYSRNHVMFGDISAWFYQALAGINVDPAQPAFKHFTIRPCVVGDLTWVRATHQSPYGPIAVAWEKKPAAFALNITVPVGTTATVYVPAASAAAVQEQGQAVGQRPGIQFLRLEDGAAVFAVGSGKYAFTAK